MYRSEYTWSLLDAVSQIVLVCAIIMFKINIKIITMVLSNNTQHLK